ncbi:MAG: transketolase C-terminal domain-containing protein [Sphaerochaeta sp.]|nr:transketolase C-terminal domain-containing protein [Sphaerochaeta sp.]
MSDAKSLRVAYGEALVELGTKNSKVVVLDADLAHATMTSMFADRYPDRFFNYGIAEQNLMSAAAGFAHSGLIPFASTFALFGAGRAYEIIRNAIAYNNTNVKIACSHSGISVGEDGGSHQSIEDIGLMRLIPNMTVLVPCDPIEMKKAIAAAATINGPVYIRVARPVVSNITTEDTQFEIGKVVTLREGTDVALISTGLMTERALHAALMLEKEGISTKVVNVHSLKPFDVTTIRQIAKSVKGIVTAEEHSVIGGLASAVSESLVGTLPQGFGFEKVAIMDTFGKSGKPEDLFSYFHLTAEDIANKARSIARRK